MKQFPWLLFIWTCKAIFHSWTFFQVLTNVLIFTGRTIWRTGKPGCWRRWSSNSSERYDITHEIYIKALVLKWCCLYLLLLTVEWRQHTTSADLHFSVSLTATGNVSISQLFYISGIDTCSPGCHAAEWKRWALMWVWLCHNMEMFHTFLWWF